MSDEALDPGLEGFSDSGSDCHELPEQPLPQGCSKEILRTAPPGLTLKRPQLGDEVCISYRVWRGSQDAPEVASSAVCDADASEFLKLGNDGACPSAFSICVPTMRLEEFARFTLSAAAAKKYGTRLWGTERGRLIFEVRLVQWIPCLDLFGDDGSVTKRLLERGEDRRKPVLGQECLFDYCLKACGSSLVNNSEPLICMQHLEHTIGLDLQGAKPPLLDMALLSMRRGELASFSCASSVAFFGESSLAATFMPQGVQLPVEVVFELRLREFLETADVSFEGDGSVMKRSLSSREFWEKCDDAGTCTLSIISVADCNGCILAKDRVWEFVIGNGDVCDVLECTAVSMRKFEVASVTCLVPQLCIDTYRSMDLDAPACPAPLTLRLTVTHYVPGPGESSEIKGTRLARRDAERIRFLEARKQIGGNLFQAGRYRLAAHRFAKVHEYLGYVDDYRNDRVAKDQKTKVADLKRSSLLNRALCLLKSNEFKLAAAACDYILDDEPHNVKALFRRSKAFMELGKFPEASRDARLALDVEPHNKDIRKLLAENRERQKKDDAGKTGMYAKMCAGLGHLPHPLDVD